ncbi:MAG: hypothetical protein ABH854_02555 [Candidatus Diapherotrites archaeon]|nr:hypothetical protein [Candidatus Micrarchaeota archaeon]
MKMAAKKPVKPPKWNPVSEALFRDVLKIQGRVMREHAFVREIKDPLVKRETVMYIDHIERAHPRDLSEIIHAIQYLLPTTEAADKGLGLNLRRLLEIARKRAKEFKELN